MNIITNKREIYKILDNDVNQFGDKLFCIRIFKKDLLTGDIATYAIYSDNAIAMSNILKREKDMIDDNRIKHLIYVNYKFYCGNLDIS